MGSTLLSADDSAGETLPVSEWLREPGLPDSRHEPVSAALDAVAETAAGWARGERPVAGLGTEGWTTQHWLRFLRSIPEGIGPGRMAELDRAFGFTRSGNAEILCEWLKMSVRDGYRDADDALSEFLVKVGRRKFLKPLYEELAKTSEGKERAREIYAAARPGYHPMATATIDAVLEIGSPPLE